MAGYPLFPNGHVALYSPPFPKNFQESMLELPTAQNRGGREALFSLLGNFAWQHTFPMRAQLI